MSDTIPPTVRGWTLYATYGVVPAWGIRTGPALYGVALGHFAFGVLRADVEAVYQIAGVLSKRALSAVSSAPPERTPV